MTQGGAEKLQAIHSLLHLVFHRNKNQHANSKWWKWLSLLKRTTLKLATAFADLEAFNTLEISIDSYKQYLRAHVVPRCYL